jgi:NADPH:quinone reductase-like Zn-dependent oxidoreductase
VHAMIISAQTDAGDLREIARLIDEGRVQPVLERVLPLVEARTAHEMSQSGHVRGKIVLDVAA